MSWLELCKTDGKEILELGRLVRRLLKEIQVEHYEGLDIRCKLLVNFGGRQKVKDDSGFQIILVKTLLTQSSHCNLEK